MSDTASQVKQALRALEKMQAKLDAVTGARTESIAIIGVGCRFPGGADDPESFWQLLRDGVDTIREVPPDRWDIEAFYDRIDHELLMKLVGKRICDRRVLKLLRQWLKAGVLDDGELLPSDQGVPQGGVISCVLANVVLHELDRLWEDRCRQLGQLIRYADDGVPRRLKEGSM